jgi:phenylalanyl-tRNA synthetase beta subunit
VSFIVPKDRFIKDEEETKKKWTIQVKDEHHFWEISNVIRDAMWEKQDLVEEVIITDIYENDKKFWENRKSVTIKIKFRSFERTLTNEEINKVYFKIRDMIENRLWYKLR